MITRTIQCFRDLVDLDLVSPEGTLTLEPDCMYLITGEVRIPPAGPPLKEFTAMEWPRRYSYYLRPDASLPLQFKWPSLATATKLRVHPS